MFILFFVFFNYAVQYYIQGQNRQKYLSRSGGMKTYLVFIWKILSPSVLAGLAHMNTKLKIYENIKETGSQHNRISPVNKGRVHDMP